MKMKRMLFALCAAALSAVSCRPDEKEHTGEYDTVFVHMGLGYNDLSPTLMVNLNDMKASSLPGKAVDDVMLVYMHKTLNGGDYTTPNPPCLMRIYSKKGVSMTDTLKVYGNTEISASAEHIREVLEDVREMFPARHYGMMLSSHATGWLPENYLNRRRKAVTMSCDEHGTPFPATRSIGSQTTGNGLQRRYHEMDLKDFAAAIPMKLDFMIFDACLMGCVEVAWELKDVCDKLVFSPAEVLEQGFHYQTLAWNLFSRQTPDLNQIAEDYFDSIDIQSGYSRSATVTVTDCRRLERLAECFRSIVAGHNAVLSSPDRNSVQGYFYDNKHYFYDLRDYARAMGASAAELEELDAALAECVLMHRETDSFFNLKLRSCCGLSCYIPIPGDIELNGYYSGLAWNKATGLVK